MTIHHHRTFGILGGCTAAAIAVLRELQQYHKANGVEYSARLPGGGEVMRMGPAVAAPGPCEESPVARIVPVDRIERFGHNTALTLQ